MYKNIYCPTQHKISGSYYTTPARCLRTCKLFPCDLFTREEIEQYIEQGYIIETFAGFNTRRTKMYLFRKKDGSLIPAPEDFDQQNPGWETMQDVEEVLYVSKILIPQIKLVPKPSAPRESENNVREKPEEKTTTRARQPKK
ncbi:MAG: hypothetical protein ACLFP9_08680 [Desulfonatronovibrio sp.]